MPNPQAEVSIEGIAELAKRFNAAPEKAGPIFADAINTVLSQISANAVDGGDDDIFRFITPRSQRTGLLNLSFNEGIHLATASDLHGTIGPTKFYAIFVHEGTGRQQANPFMERLAKATEPITSTIWQDALDKLTQSLI